MGKEIVYCGDCGKSLREDDFTRGKAHHIDHRPYCSECKAPVAAPSQIQTSSRLAAMKTPTGRQAVPPPMPSTRRHRLDAESSKTPLLVGAGLVVAAVAILLIFARGSGGRSPAPGEPPPPPPRAASSKPAPKPPPSTPEPEKGAAALQALEAVAGGAASPVAILQKCEEVRPLLQGTAHEARLKAIEERAREQRRVQQLDASLEEVKKLRALDPGYERKEEIVRLLNATLPLAGARRPEVEETLRAYERDAQAYVPPAPIRPAPVLNPAPASSEALGPYETDASGAVRHWLVLGPFKNRTHADGLYDADLLKPEASHVPSPGLEVTTREGTKVRWTPMVAADGTLDFAQAGAAAGVPAIFFAACWVDAEIDLEAKVRVIADLGFILHLDGKRFRNQPRGHRIGEEQDIVRTKLAAGPHLFLFKVACPTGPGYLQLKLTQNGPERMRGLRIWTQAPAPRRILYAQSFNDGVDGFESGSLSDDGVDGSKALLVRNAAAREQLLTTPVTSGMRIRFKVKHLAGAKAIQLILWCAKARQNYWYHVRNLPGGEWTSVEFPLSAVRGGYKMEGPSVEGQVPMSFRFHVEAMNGVEGQALIDDLQILE